MKIWAFVNQKGGAGKSTLSTQLAAYAASIGEKCVIVDLDPQSSAHAWFEVRGGNNPAVVRALPDRLAKLIHSAKESGAFTMLFVDTAPHTDKAAVEAIRSAELIICPACPGLFDMRAFKDTVELLELAQAKDRAIGVVNKVTVQGAAKTYAETSEQLERFEIRVAGAYVNERIAFKHATNIGKGVTELAASKGNREAASEIVRLWGELSEAWPVPTPSKARAQA